MSWKSKPPDPDSRRGRALAKGEARAERLREKSDRLKAERAEQKATATERKALTDRAVAMLVPPRKCPSCRKRMKTGAWACHHCGRDHSPDPDAPIMPPRM